MYSATTNGIQVTVQPKYLEDQSNPTEGRYFWAYTIEIANTTDEPVQILTRHWIITDGNGQRQEVKGPGIVGEQPVISPGGSYTYTSGCPLTTPSGIMAGTYQATGAHESRFPVTIPAFSLDLPDARNVLN